MDVARGFSQQRFTSSALVKVLGIETAMIGSYMSIAIEGKTSPGNGIDVEVALGVMTQAMFAKLGMHAVGLAHAYNPFIRAALLHLASNAEHWCFTAEDSELFSRLFDENEGAGLRRRRLQELFGDQDRPTHRYLIRRPGEAWSVGDNVGDNITSGKEPLILVLDATALADKLSSSFSGPFFNWQPQAAVR